MWLTVTQTTKCWFVLEFEKKTRKLRRPANSGNASNEVDLEQPSWNPHSKRLEAAVFWTTWLTVTKNKWRFIFELKSKSKKMGRPDNFRECIKWGWLWTNIMECKLETVWSGCVLNDVPYSNSHYKIKIYRRVWKYIWENQTTCKCQGMHRTRLTWSKHNGTQTRNDLKRPFFERCGLQSLQTKWGLILNGINMENQRTCQFQEMPQMSCLCTTHHGIQTRNCLKRMFVGRCALQ